MAPMIFAKAIIEGKPIEIFNFGKMRRDFTYIDDIVSGIIKCRKSAISNPLFDELNPDPATSLLLIEFLILGIEIP